MVTDRAEDTGNAQGRDTMSPSWAGGDPDSEPNLMLGRGTDTIDPHRRYDHAINIINREHIVLDESNG